MNEGNDSGCDEPPDDDQKLDKAPAQIADVEQPRTPGIHDTPVKQLDYEPSQPAEPNDWSVHADPSQAAMPSDATVPSKLTEPNAADLPSRGRRKKLKLD